MKNPYILFRQIFRCAQQHVQISRHNSFVATYRELQRNNKTNVLLDLRSDSIENKDLRSAILTYNKLYIGSIWIEISAALNIRIADLHASISGKHFFVEEVSQ